MGWRAPVAPRSEIWQFSCGLLTTEPLRYYVCPGAVTKGLNMGSSVTLDTPSTVVKFIGGGAQQAAADVNFPSSQRSAAADLATLFDNCENGPAMLLLNFLIESLLLLMFLLLILNQLQLTKILVLHSD